MSWLALLLYAAWTMLLVLAIGTLRSTYTLSGKRAANRFSPFGEDVSAFSGRLCRAHANCYENLPVLTAVLVVAGATDNLAVTDPLALPLVAARLGQSMVHIASTSVPAVLLRFGLYGVQLIILGYWIFRLVPVVLG